MLKQLCCFVEIQKSSTEKHLCKIKMSSKIIIVFTVIFDQGSMHPYLLKTFKLQYFYTAILPHL